MVFASSIFLYYFLPLFLLIYYVSPRAFRSFIIAFSSYLFYGWWRPDFVLLMLISTVVDYSCGRAIIREKDRGLPGKRWVVVSAVANLGLLGYFKYANFGIDTLNHIIGQMGLSPIPWTEIVLPIGISFYTFQTMSYTIDVYRGTSPPVKTFRDFMCYVALFPQLIAGPIVRYNTVATQLHSRTHTIEKFYRGILFFQVGFAKKILIADLLAPLADQAFGMTHLSLADSWIGTLAFTVQLFFDFSGYSDMAIGLGLMMGFEFPINFNRPHRAVSITDLWRRWHISLSAFLHDYLYVPLGGNRRGRGRTYFNLALTMLLCGLWHGAAWTYVVFGVYHASLLILERALGKRAPYSWAPKPVQVLITFVIWMIGLVIFKSSDVNGAFGYIGCMFGFGSATAKTTVLRFKPAQILACTIGMAIVWIAPATHKQVPRAGIKFAILLQLIFLFAVIHLHHQDHVPFIYYQF